MKRTRICELLDIEYTIICGAMGHINGPELIAAVSNAGGFGILVADGDETGIWVPEHYYDLIKRTRELTNKPFGINLPLHHHDVKKAVEIAIEEKIPAVTMSAGSPALYTSYLKQAGIKAIQLLGCVKHAIAAEKAGVDAVIAEGFDAGGLNAVDEIPTFSLIPQVVDAVKVPVIAAGGIADSRGILAAFALGAEGVQIGTRFMATPECLAHPNFKQALLDAGDNSTFITGRGFGLVARTLKNKFVEEFIKMEKDFKSKHEIDELVWGKCLLGERKGDIVNGEMMVGAAVGLVKKIVSAGDLMQELVEEYESELAKLCRP
jgi:enoyl-[acyl-carrier protein] reductase II